MRHLLLVLFLGFVVDTSVAQTIMVEVTIQSVKPEAKEVTVRYKTSLGEKTIALDVSRRATITLNGREATLESLGAGQTGTIEFHRELEIVTKIEVSGKAFAPPKLINLSELNGSFPALSEDGLTVYWDKNYVIWTARRESPESYFTSKQELFPGNYPAISADGLEMIFRSPPNWTLHVTTRENVESAFRRAKEIRELSDAPDPRNPYLSSDGLTLYFNSGDDESQIVFTTRANRTSPWSSPKGLPIQFRGEGCLCWPCVAADELTMFCVVAPKVAAPGKLMLWSRDSVEKPFSEMKYVELEGLPELRGRCPRYVAATNELFLQQVPDGGRPIGLISVIKNFDPDQLQE